MSISEMHVVKLQKENMLNKNINVDKVYFEKPTLSPLLQLRCCCPREPNIICIRSRERQLFLALASLKVHTDNTLNDYS